MSQIESGNLMLRWDGEIINLTALLARVAGFEDELAAERERVIKNVRKCLKPFGLKVSTDRGLEIGFDLDKPLKPGLKRKAKDVLEELREWAESHDGINELSNGFYGGAMPNFIGKSDLLDKIDQMMMGART